MSQRAIRRAQQRKLAGDRRRETLRRRRTGLAAGAAIGATALFAPSAQGASFVVNTTTDHAADACDAAPDCTLRDAITEANANSEADVITFQSGLSGTIRLTAGQLVVGPASNYGLTITGPGRDVLSISGDADDSNTPNAGDYRIFNISGTGAVTISGLTMTEGYVSGGSAGAAVFTANNTKVTITDSAITNSRNQADDGAVAVHGTMDIIRTKLTGNSAPGGTGGAIFASPNSPYGGSPLTITDSTISGNTASNGGGIDTYVPTTVTGTEISGNNVPSDGGGIRAGRALTISGSTITGNTATNHGGGLSMRGKYALHTSDSVISGNTAGAGGGIHVSKAAKYGSGARSEISGTTISGNHAVGAMSISAEGAGINVVKLSAGERFTVSRSTISGNDGAAGSFGGGIAFGGDCGCTVEGAFDLVNSTISGNTAESGGGVSLGNTGENQVVGEYGSIGFDNSTIASNTATSKGGGFYLAQYDSTDNPPVKKSATVSLTSTLVGDNTAAGAAQDLDRIDTSTAGGFDVSLSLIEAPGDAPLVQDPGGASITGVDPQLGALAGNGGTTKTHLPAPASPAIDKGSAPSRLTTDQRGQPRTVDGGVDNPAGGDGTDIGSVEIANPPPKPPAPPPPPPPPRADLAPTAVIKKNALRSKKAAKRRAAGTATDDHEVVRVEVALVRKTRGNCRELLSSGRFSRSRRCRRPRTFLKANGTTAWSFKLATELDPGYYVVYARAVDDAGNTQISFGTKSRRPFRVR